jgi:predicted ribonuclease toxin of YeeF-YezG toxin-antitoxin module
MAPRGSKAQAGIKGIPNRGGTKMARKTAKKATKRLHRGKRIEKRTTLKKAAAAPIKYLTVEMPELLITGGN